MNRELLQQALNALLISAPLGHAMEDYEYRHRLIKDIEAELAEPEQEPQMIQIKDGQLSYIKKPWVGLTDEQLSETYNDLYTQYTRDDVNIADFILIARAIEALLKEKNNAV
jgi:hypothetical protein